MAERKGKEVSQETLYLKMGMSYLISTLGYGGQSKLARKLGVSPQYVVNIMSLDNPAMGNTETQEIICRTLACPQNMMRRLGKYLIDRGLTSNKIRDIDIDQQMEIAADIAGIRGLFTVYKLSRKNLVAATQTIAAMQSRGYDMSPDAYADLVIDLYDQNCKHYGYFEDSATEMPMPHDTAEPEQTETL